MARTAVPPAKPATKSTTVVDALEAAPTGIVEISLDLIDPHPDNPRKDLGDLTELTASITAQGVLQNVTVVPHPDDPTRYRALLGHRRIAASRAAGISAVPAGIRTGLDAAAQIELMLIENLQRTDLTITEEGDGYQGLLDLGISKAQIVKRTGRAKSTVDNRIIVAGMPAPVRARVDEHQLSIEDVLTLADWRAEYPEIFEDAIHDFDTSNAITSNATNVMNLARGKVTLERQWRDAVDRLKARGVELVTGIATRGEQDLQRLGIPSAEHDSCPGAQLYVPQRSWSHSAEQRGSYLCADPETHHPDEYAAFYSKFHAAKNGTTQPASHPVESDEARARREAWEESVRVERAAREGRATWAVMVLSDPTDATADARASLVEAAAVYAREAIVRTAESDGWFTIELEPGQWPASPIPTTPAEALANLLFADLNTSVVSDPHRADEYDIAQFTAIAAYLEAIAQHGPTLTGELHYDAPVEAETAQAYRARITEYQEALAAEQAEIADDEVPTDDVVPAKYEHDEA
jgi:ParB family chromosome partitioning protein